MKPAGFTLLETMVALALTAIVLTSVRGLVDHVAARRDHAIAAADRVDRTRSALEQIAADLASTVAPDPTAAPRIELHPARPRVGTWPTLRVATATADALAETQVITYAVVADPQPHLVRRGPFGEVTLLDAVRAFRVRARGQAEWVDEWLDDAPPRAVEIALAVASPAADEPPLQTVVPIPVGAWR